MTQELNAADAPFAAALRDQLPPDTIRVAEPRYLEEPRGRHHASSTLVALPRTVEEVAACVGLAAERRVGVVPYGGGTGLVGGQVCDNGPSPLILSLERMSAIRQVYPDENVLIAEAGAILADVQAAARGANRLFPLSLASEGTARIGGNLATNAGGTGVLRYGNARDLCLGLEVVLPDGQIWHGLSRLRKDNTGYDLRNLMIGSEGTLGVITAASLKLSPTPQDTGTALLFVPDPASALQLLTLARQQFGEMVSSFELMHRQGFAFLRETIPELRLPFETLPDWTVLIELGLSGGLGAATALEDLFAAGAEEGLVLDGLIAQSATQANTFWTMRESIPEANRRIGSISSHDVSLPLGALPDFIDEASRQIARLGDFRVNCFGHVGDGNLHYNVFPAQGESRETFRSAEADIQRCVYDLVHSLGGSVSAEHGIGRLKVGDLERYGDPAKLSAMRAIKAALDPLGIMNPGAVLGAD